MPVRYAKLQRQHEARMERFIREIDAANNAPPTPAQENEQLRADLATLCGLLRAVRYVQTVGEINHIRMTCDNVEARWKITAVRND